MSRKTLWTILGVAVMALAAGQAQAADMTFDGNGGTGGNWATANNWNPNTVPGTADRGLITAATSSAAPAYIQSSVGTVVQWQVGTTTTGSNGYLKINTGANIVTTGTGEVGINVYNGTVTQTAGAVISGADAHLCVTNGGTSAQGLYQISGGTVTVGGIWFGHSGSATASGTFLQTGGTVTLIKTGGNAGRWPEGATTVNINLAGGTLTCTAGTPNLGNGVTTPATLTISGSAKASMKSLTVGRSGKIVLNGAKTGDGTDFSLVSGDRFTWSESATFSGATVKAVIDTAAVNTPASMRKIACHEITINQGALIDVGFASGTTPAAGTWTILTWTGSDPTPANVSLASGVAAGWSFSVNTTANAVTVTYVNQAPNAPSGLTATAVSSTQINLSWTDNSNNETGFKIERKTGSGGTYAQIGTVGAGVTTYQSTGLTAATNYYYRVRATNANGDSAYSNEANATTLPNPPSAPSGLTATAVSSSQINLAWTDNSNNETGFKIERKTGVGGTYAQIGTVGAGVTTYQNTGLAAATNYYYRVRATNTGGDSAYSNEANATTSGTGGDVGFDGNGGTGGNWATANNWNPDTVPGTADRALIIAATSSAAPAYIQSNVGTVSKLWVGTSNTGYLNINSGAVLTTADTSEDQSIRVGDGYGKVVQSGGSVTVKGGLDLSKGSGTAIWQISGGTLTAGNNIFIGHEGGSNGTLTQTGGTITMNGNGGDKWRLAGGAGSVGTFTMSGGTLTSSSGGMQVGAGGAGTLKFSGSAQPTISGSIVLYSSDDVIILDGSKTGAGTDVLTSGGDRFTMSNNSAGSTLRALIDSAAITTPANMRKLVVNNITVNAGSLIDVGFASGTTPAAGTWTILTWAGADPTPANLALAGTVGAGWSFNVNTSTNALTVTYVTGGGPNAPSGLSATAVSSSQINLSWTDNSNNETGFKIERKTGAGGTYAQIATVGANVTTYQNTGLAAATNYYYRVRATNANGDSAYSNEANATTWSTASGLTGQGFNIHITGPASDWDSIAAAGGKFVRADFSWSNIETTQGVYNFSTQDTMLAALEARGIRVIAVLAYRNPLYTDPETTQQGRTAYAAFAAAAAEHFAGHNILWEIWNEPNVGFWHGTGGENSRSFADQYMALLEETVPAMRDADPNCYILGASCSCLWSQSLVWMDECLLQGLMTSGINAISVHPYGFTRPETCIDASQPGAVQGEGYWTLRSLMTTYGNGSFPVVNSEVGFATGTNVTADEQAMLTVRMFLVDQLCNIGFTNFYNWDENDAAAFVFRGSPTRLNYTAVQRMNTELAGYHFVQGIKVGPNLDYQLAFENASQARIITAWTVPAGRDDPQHTATAHNVTISTTGWAGGGSITVRDIYGNAVSFTTGSGTVTVNVTASPVYIYLGAHQ